MGKRGVEVKTGVEEKVVPMGRNFTNKFFAGTQFYYSQE